MIHWGWLLLAAYVGYFAGFGAGTHQDAIDAWLKRTGFD